MPNLIEQSANAAQKAGSGTAVISGTWAWMGTHYQEIGALCAVVGVVIAITGLAVQIHHTRRIRRYREIEIDNQRIYGGDDA